MGHFDLESFDNVYFNVVIDLFGLHQQPGPVSLEPLLEAFKIKLRYERILPDIDGMALIIRETDEKIICVRNSLDSSHRRFVLGHELGHIFQQKMGNLLCSPVRDWTKETWQYSEPLEEEADAISAYLYVPLAFLKQKLYLNTPFEAIAAELEVPYHAVRLRYDIALATAEFLL